MIQLISHSIQSVCVYGKCKVSAIVNLPFERYVLIVAERILNFIVYNGVIYFCFYRSNKIRDQSIDGGQNR